MQRSELIHQLRLLRRLEPREEWVASSKTLMLREIQRQSPAALLLPQASGAAAGLMWSQLSRLALQPVFTLSASLVVALAAGLTVNAAFYSLPGEPLYRVKLAFERTQLALQSNSAKKTELKVEFVKNRVKEIEKLVSHTAAVPVSQRQVKQVVSRFTKEVASVRKDLPRLPADQRAVFQIALSLDQAGSDLATKLKPATTDHATPSQREIRQAVREAVAAAEATSYSALDVAISHPPVATSSQQLPSKEVEQYLEEKIGRLREQAKQLPSTTADDAAVLRAFTAALDAAQAQVSQRDFSTALATLAEVRAKLDALNGARPEPVATPTPAATPDLTPSPKAKPTSRDDVVPGAAAATSSVTAVTPVGAETVAEPEDVTNTRETTQDFINHQQAEAGFQKPEASF